MSENLIPQNIIDLVERLIRSTDSNEQTKLEFRVNDIAEYLQSALKSKRSSKKRIETSRDLTGRGGLG